MSPLTVWLDRDGALLRLRLARPKANIVDAAIVDGTHSLMSFVHGMAGLGQWRTQREGNLLDGAAPFYRCYMTADGKFMAVGCIEPQFFAAMMERLPIDAGTYGGQHDRAAFAKQHEMLEDVFGTKTRDEWEAVFAGTDACVTPVLDYVEAAAHPANAERQAVVQDSRWLHPQIAPRLRRDRRVHWSRDCREIQLRPAHSRQRHRDPVELR